MDFRKQWLEAVQRKQSILCVGIDAAEAEQDRAGKVPRGMGKVDWTLRMIADVAPFAAAIKLNRNYYKDLAREAMQEINAAIHAAGMLSIDDCKLADIGDTNDAGIYHTRRDGFDALTYAPFPANTRQAAEQARAHKVGLISLVLMSNPEFAVMKNAQIEGQPFYLYLAKEAAEAGVSGIVVGAPSPGNHLSLAEIEAVAAHHSETLVLVPGIGAQGGELAPIVQLFHERTIANVGRAIIYAPDPRKAAEAYRDSFRELLNSRRS